MRGETLSLAFQCSVNPVRYNLCSGRMAESTRNDAATFWTALLETGMLWHWMHVDRAIGSVFWSALVNFIRFPSFVLLYHYWSILRDILSRKHTGDYMPKANFPVRKVNEGCLDTARQRKERPKGTWSSNCKFVFISVSVWKLLTVTWWFCFVLFWPKLAHYFLHE